MNGSTVFATIAMVVSAALAFFMLGEAGESARESSTALQEARAAIERLEGRLRQLEAQTAAWDALPVGVVLLDALEQAHVCNQRAREILGSPREGGQSLTELTTNPEVLAGVRRALRQHGTVSGAITLAPGVFVEMVARVLEDGSLLLLLQDVSELRMLRTVRRDFVANVSHELRTPLASIRLLVDTLEDGALEEPEVATNFVHRIGVEADHLIQMVTELLELSRIESGQLPVRGRELAEVGELIGLAVQRLSVVALDKQIAVTSEVRPGIPLVLADRDQVVQVLMNLLFNAIKFTPRGGAVHVRAWPESGSVSVAVIDTGMGIAPADLPRIFERFYKSDKARSRSGGGTGLGLPIARHIVESHGGSIRAESQEGNGSTFTFTLPEG